MLHPSLSQTRTMLDNVCKPAIATELIDKGIQVNIQEKSLEEEPELYHLDLTIQLDEEENFVYEIWPVRYDTPNFSSRGKRTKRYYYRLESYLFEGSQGNDLVGYSKEQVINDILDKYERHMMYLHINRSAQVNVHFSRIVKSRISTTEGRNDVRKFECLCPVFRYSIHFDEYLYARNYS